MKAFSKKSSYLLIIMMIAALLLTGTVPSFAAKNKKTYTTPEGTALSAGENDDPGRHPGGKGNQCYYDRRGKRQDPL